MTKQYHYRDLVSDALITSDTPLSSNGLELILIVDSQYNPAQDELKSLALLDLPKLIGKQQKAATTDDPWQMWRYYNNADVAREVLAGTVDAETLVAFEEMLTENKLSDPDYYGAMTTQAFAEWLIGLNREFKLMGLRLEAERIRQRRVLNGSL
jgi:hypothetical protein